MQPQLTKSRLITVDALRGCALFGIMLAHFIYWYTAGPLPSQVFNKYTDVGSRVADIFNNLLITGKFFAFFSFLFGLSFFLQMRGLEHDQKKFVARYAWRLTLLLVIGLVHHALWMGDILSIYVPLGFVLLFIRRFNNRTVLILGILLVLNVPGKLIEVGKFFTQPQQQQFGDFNVLGKAYGSIVSSGSLADVLRYNMKNLSEKFQFQIDSGRLFITLGFFMLGMFVGRKRWFERGEAARPVIRKICKRSASLMGVALVCN